ncbi:TIGR03086 family protein [Streptomyces cinnamoneus]|uniref:TIGR03086 family protein n=1 Tax=Streptomyces cinnamoneus TaxID=53446 RepID=A0A2G1XNX0_STRCJ|nr:TIGR03086 family metal-binding protein [Streptomyces cinnamoneus]PHQ52913.1 TIGR03086 family protein [Streptomyces cinnamoneus]PPT11426.1 TIGR03086 family protein [Streptomyces cinnamoneus]
MTVDFDLGPAAQRMAGLLRAVDDEWLTAPTPCERYTLGDLIEHVGGLAGAFTAAATKTAPEPAGSPPPSGDAARLETDWRTRIPERLTALADAWRDPAAWEGVTRAGGVDLPAGVAARVALDELVVHGWDVARATGQPFDCDEAELAACLEFVSGFPRPDPEERPADGGLFGPPVDVPADAPPLDRMLGLTGRDPGWTPA